MDAIIALIVDDSSVMRKIVERSLRQAGINRSRLFEAGNGAEALNVLSEHRVDLILCDINIPVMDGLEFIKQLPAVASAKNVDHDRRQRSSRGAGAFLRRSRLFTAEQVKEHVIPVLGVKA